jgi:hypothetical protein
VRASRSFGEADRTTVRDDRAVYRGWFPRAIRGLYDSFINGGLAFLRNIHPENILSLLILAAHGLTLQMKSVSFGTNFSFHSSPLPVLDSVFSFILANFLVQSGWCYLIIQKNFFFGNKWGHISYHIQ